MASAAGAKRFAMFAGATATAMTATETWMIGRRLPPVTIVAGGFLATGMLLVLADAVPNVGAALAALVLLSTVLSRADLFRAIATRIGA